MKTILKLRITVWAIVVLAFGVGLLWLLVPAPSGVDHSQFYSPFGTPTTLIDLTIAICGGFLFLKALNNFKQELKPAYRYIAGAQLAVGVLTLMYPYIEYYNLWENNWFNMSSYLGYLAGSVLMYFGARQFLKILGLRGRATAPWVMAGVTLVAWFIHTIAPHNPVWTTFSEHQYDAFEVVVIIPVLFYAVAAYSMFRISRTIGSEYRRGFRWLAGGLALQLCSAIGLLIMDMTGYDTYYFNTRLYEVPTIAADVLILVAGYYFNAVGLAAHRGGFWRRLFGGEQQETSSLDIINFVAGMVSNPKNIDNMLDRVRLLSANVKPGEALNSDQQSELRKVYLDIEEYLIADEPLRKFNRQDIRTNIVSHFSFGENTDNKTFWRGMEA